MDILQLLGQIFSKTDNIAIVVLSAMLGVSLWLHVIWRREEREDRKQMMELLARSTEAYNGLRNVLSAALGKVI